VSPSGEHGETVQLVRRQTTMTRAIALLAALGALVALVTVACGATASATPSSISGGTMTVTGAWVRAAAAGGETAAYFTIVNGTSTDDALDGASTDAAESATVHLTSTDPSGMTGMQMAPSVTVPGGGTVPFAPGGYHVMLTNLKGALKAGDQVRLTLTFQHAGAVTVAADVRPN
jgi:periplasmic copper chaperone A